MRAALHAVGDPHERLRFVHIAGTNGKGSTAAFVDAMLRAAGHRAGLFTSPHLSRFTERIRVDGRELATVIGRDVPLARRDTLVVRGVYVAPGFEVRHGGADDAAGYLKLVPGRREYFQVGLLPHRFYVTLPPTEGRPAGAAAAIRLSVQRGKLVVVPARDVGLGEKVEFEGLTVQFAEGAPWARIEVHRRAARWFGAAAAALLVAAAWILAGRWRRA